MAIINGRKVTLKPGQVLLIEAGDRHAPRMGYARSPMLKPEIPLEPGAVPVTIVARRTSP